MISGKNISKNLIQDLLITFLSIIYYIVVREKDFPSIDWNGFHYAELYSVPVL